MRVVRACVESWRVLALAPPNLAVTIWSAFSVTVVCALSRVAFVCGSLLWVVAVCGSLMLIHFSSLLVRFCCSRPRVGSRPRAVQRRTGAGASTGACRASEGSSRPWVSGVERCIWASVSGVGTHGTQDVLSKRQGRGPGWRQCEEMCSERLRGRARWRACLSRGAERSFTLQYARPCRWSMDVS